MPPYIVDIDESVLHDLKTIFKEHFGSQTLQMNIFDKKEGIQLELMSKTYKVDASNKLLGALKGVSAISHTKVNAK